MLLDLERGCDLTSTDIADHGFGTLGIDFLFLRRARGVRLLLVGRIDARVKANGQSKMS